MSDDQRVHRQNSDGVKDESAQALPEDGQSRARSAGGRSPYGQKSGLKVALIHDWLNGMRGGEIVFEALLDLFPDADVFTLIYEPRKLSPELRAKLEKRKVTASWLNTLRFTRKNYRQLLPLLPLAIKSFDVYPYDLIISSSHCVAKGVKKRSGAFHLSYVHAPMRYMWDRFNDYFGKGRVGPFIRMAAKLFRPLLQGWDKRTAQTDRVDVLVANSDFIGEQIERCYGRKSTTVYPFANLERFTLPKAVGNFYLMVGAFAPYKRTDLAIEAFARMGLPLKIVGQGQDEVRLRALHEKLGARNIEFLSRPSNAQIEQLYGEAKAFIFPGKEDFGITPLEAMASGTPVIAFGEGGACETVTAQTGILFRPQTVDALCEAVLAIETGRKYFDPKLCVERAQFFTKTRFQAEIMKILKEKTKIENDPS
jgi:glycosyltransferase involved in cell wall biosynthesis